MRLENLANVPAIRELRNKILFTFFILFLYRLGTHIPVPGVDVHALAEYFKTNLQGTAFEIYDIFAGGALSRAAILGVGIMPYISASIIMQLLATSVPTIERLQKEGEHGRRKINQYTRYLTIVVAAIQSIGVTVFLSNLTAPSGIKVVPDANFMFYFTTIVALVGGTMLLMWMGELITQYGIGNGISVIIFAGTLDTLPGELVNTIRLVRTGSISPFGLVFALVVMGVLTVATVAITQAQRRLPIQYAKRIVGNRVYGGQSTYLPLTVNTAGVIPIIFAQSLLMLPQTALTFARFPGMEKVKAFVDSYFVPASLPYDLTYAVLIIGFAYMYTSVVINPRDLADNLQRYSGFIPGIRPGPKTAEYIDRVLARIILPGAVFFALVAVIPSHLMKWTHVPIYYGGTRLLIIVGVALELVQQIESHLIMHQYEGLLKRGRIRGWR